MSYATYRSSGHRRIHYVNAKRPPRRPRQSSDSGSLAHGCVPRYHDPRENYSRALTPPPANEMFGQGTYGKPTPARIHRNSYASQQYVLPYPLQNRSCDGPHPWAFTLTFDLALQEMGRYSECLHTSTSPRFAAPPPQPAPNRIRTKNSQFASAGNQGIVKCEIVAARLVEIRADLNNRKFHDSQHYFEVEELEDLVRCLSIVEEKIWTEQVMAQHSRKSDETPHTQEQIKTGLINYKKTWMFANSRLPLYQPPFQAYIETWRLICMAARASAEVYQRPQRDRREQYFGADWRYGTKAMVLKNTLVDGRKLVVLAIRGSRKSIVDWAINFHSAPVAMVAPVAARLRQLLEQEPFRCTSSLVITGYSAGGAVASLLYMHMLATRVNSALNVLTGCFKRIHCVTFGTPPVSLLPLEKPSHLRKSKDLFISFVNEGDLIVRADVSYLLSLGKLLALPWTSSFLRTVSALNTKGSHAESYPRNPNRDSAPYWVVPEATLANAGRLILLREKPGTLRDTSIEAVMTTDKKLRDVVFGDPAMHMVAPYSHRVEELAITALLGEDGGSAHGI